MEPEFVTPNEAVERLMRKHYPGAKRGNVRRVRMALIGALRSGFLEWQCERWSEIFTAESGAVYSDFEVPVGGLPDDFWLPQLALDSNAWLGNLFISIGQISIHSVRNKVGRWLVSNGDAVASVSRTAESVQLNWSDACNLLDGPGWQVWINEAHNGRPAQLRVWRYEAAMIEMIAVAVQTPEVFASRQAIYERLHQAFDTYGNVPDEKTIGRLASHILAATLIENSDAPTIS